MGNPYSDKLMELFENPVNVGSFETIDDSIGTGEVGSAACGDLFKLQIKVDKETKKIVDVKFKTFGCCAAIASASLATEWMKGKTLEEALEITNNEIAIDLELPIIKQHCSVLVEDTIEAAIKDYESKHESC
ncbi:Fe-S cluster assembly scaffold IscU [candidate division WWE3 bacterium]|nr:Fe-S cluster assembly scaffold IscU [candidate division WWE3 bacterium]